jgi:GrpB-like predicted nucleotidyltransferase (UPF0157 family)
MKKRLADMTNLELSKLFPIQLVEASPRWSTMFGKEAVRIRASLDDRDILRIEHIGSTAVPGLKAKPTIDILLEVIEQIDNDVLIKTMRSVGYHYIHQPENPAPHMMFAKGYTMKGFRGQAYHVHVRYSDDWDELYFRDYLRLHPQVAQEYVELKEKLAMKYKHDRDGYTRMKTDFISRINRLAREELKGSL